MNANPKITPVPLVVAASASSASTGGDYQQSRAAQEAERAARYRLVIEEGPSQGSFVYKTLDRLTGEVVRQFPREEVVQLMSDETYSAGAVIDTNA
jgi:flagellar protein FlaG